MKRWAAVLGLLASMALLSACSSRVYAPCIDGEDERWYKRMEEFLG